MLRLYFPLAALGLLGAVACADRDGFLDPAEAISSRAFAIWHPGSNDTCSQEQHDAYAVIGPDGKAYPTWHPSTGPGGCSFGHEHGRDPSGSDLFADVGGIPFGVASEMLAITDPANPRDEDHVGHKVEWENDVTFTLSGEGASATTTVCDVLLKLHQGTHSPDAFTNNLHELVYHLRCEDGAEMHVTLLVAIGKPGEFERSCETGRKVSAGPARPANSPAGFGVRRIPDRACIERHLLVPPGEEPDYVAALHESWQLYSSIERSDGHALAFFNPWFQVELPSRFHDPAAASRLGRSIEACYQRGGRCTPSAASAAPYDDPRSLFKGAERMVNLNSVRISNAGGATAWYTDALGRRGSTTPFPGSIRQRVASVDRYVGVDIGGPIIGGDRDYGGQGVHAPN